MARVISDTGIPDKSVGNRVADRSWTRDTVRTRQIHRICARQSAYRADFFLSLSPRAQYRPPVIIASRRLTRRVEIVSFSRTRWPRTVRIINGIGSPDFGTITVTVTIMEEGRAITTAEIATALFLSSSRRNIGLILRHLGRRGRRDWERLDRWKSLPPD